MLERPSEQVHVIKYNRLMLSFEYKLFTCSQAFPFTQMNLLYIKINVFNKQGLVLLKLGSINTYETLIMFFFSKSKDLNDTI